MSDLRASIASLKLALDKMPRDNNSRPMHEALIACFEAVAEDDDALKLAVWLIVHAVDAGESEPCPNCLGWDKTTGAEDEECPVCGQSPRMHALRAAGTARPDQWAPTGYTAYDVSVPKRKGWPKGKPRKPVEAVNG